MKKLLGLTVCFIFIGAIYSFASPVKQNPLELGVEISHREYKEPGLSKQGGLMYGLLGSYTYRNNCMLKAEGLFSFGQVDYSSVTTGTMNNIDDYVLEFRGLAGYDFPVSTGAVYTPYIGIGYRYLNDAMGGRYSSTNNFGYDRESNYIYSPIGIEAVAALENGWSFGTTLEYDYFWQGTQKSNMGWKPGYYDIENHQKRGYGLRGSIEFKKKCEKVDYVIKPFVRYWNIKDSDITIDPGAKSWEEPKNTTTEFGIQFAVKF